MEIDLIKWEQPMGRLLLVEGNEEYFLDCFEKEIGTQRGKTQILMVKDERTIKPALSQ